MNNSKNNLNVENDGLSFSLPNDYYLFQETDDDGNPYYDIKAEKGHDDQGKETYKYFLQLRHYLTEGDAFPEGVEQKGFALKGRFKNRVNVLSTEQQILFFTLSVFDIRIYIIRGEHKYALGGRRAVRSSGIDEELAGWTAFLNRVLASFSIFGEPCDFEELTPEMLLSKKNETNEGEELDSDYPLATPLEGQHTHLDFLNNTKDSLSIFGGLLQVNQSGTEYAFESLGDHIDDDKDYDDDDKPEMERNSVLKTIKTAKSTQFELAETASAMAELFRVNKDFFDAGHDREQEILNGYIHRAAIYNMFRSFAWTLQAYCEKEEISPAQLSFDQVEDLVTFIETRKGLNYIANSCSPVLCSGDDLHVYYVPDSVPSAVKKKILSLENADIKTGEKQASACSVQSLDGLRKELEYMYPAIRAIYDQLEETRDPDEPLEGGVADILYAWCSMTYAAREPFFSEDGPMNNFWEHPDEAADSERQMRINDLNWAIKQKKEWLSRHRKDLSVNAVISFAGKTFVFDGAQSTDEWLEILQKLMDKGGLHRTAVSGKTDYLVCNPYYAGDSKIRKVQEQRIKGKDIKIVLFDDFLSSLRMKVKTPQEELEELKKASKKPVREKKLMPVDRSGADKTAKSGQQDEKEKTILDDFGISFQDGITAQAENYTMDIPDGFVFDDDSEGRAFIAYRPDEGDRIDSSFIIFDSNVADSMEVLDEAEALTENVILATLDIFLQSQMLQMKNMFEGSKRILIAEPEICCGINVSYDPGVIHANYFIPFPGGIQMIRLQIQENSKSRRKKYDELFRELAKHIHMNKSYQYLEAPDAVTRQEKVSVNTIREWGENIQRHANAINLVRQINMATIKSTAEEMSRDGSSSYMDVKKMAKDVALPLMNLQNAIARKAEDGFNYIINQKPTKELIDKLKGCYELFLSQACVETTINGETLGLEPKEARAVKARFEAKQINDNSQKKDAVERFSKTVGIIAKKKQTEEADLIAREKAEAEQRAKEEAERKQEEELRNYERAYSEWQSACSEAAKKREAYVAESLSKEKVKLEAEAANGKDKAIAEANAVILAQTERRSQAEKILSSLGIFRFSEKKAQKAIIEESSRLALEAQQSLSGIETAYQSRLTSISRQIKEEEQSIRRRAEEMFPVPIEPLLPERMVRQEKASAKKEEKSRLGAKEKKVLSILKTAGEEMTATDVAEVYGKDVSVQEMSAVLRQLSESGYVTKTIRMRRSYFKAT